MKMAGKAISISKFSLRTMRENCPVSIMTVLKNGGLCGSSGSSRSVRIARRTAWYMLTNGFSATCSGTATVGGFASGAEAVTGG